MVVKIPIVTIACLWAMDYGAIDIHVLAFGVTKVVCLCTTIYLMAPGNIFKWVGGLKGISKFPLFPKYGMLVVLYIIPLIWDAFQPSLEQLLCKTIVKFKVILSHLGLLILFQCQVSCFWFLWCKFGFKGWMCGAWSKGWYDYGIPYL